MDANNNNDAVTVEMRMAPSGPKSMISLPVVSITPDPNKELPMPKHGAMINVERIMIKRNLSPWTIISNSFEIMEAMGPLAFATLFDPIAKAT